MRREWGAIIAISGLTIILSAAAGLNSVWQSSPDEPQNMATNNNATPAASQPKGKTTPFASRHEKIAPFTNNDNRVAKLLWSYRFAIEGGHQGCQGDESNMWVEPNTVVFIKFVDGSNGEVKAGTPSDRRRVRNTSEKWMAARFVAPGNMKYSSDIQISKRELFVVCDASENTVLHLEARRLP